MGILRTIIWVFLTVILVVFAMANWSPVTVTIWPGQVLDTKLPVLIFAAFLIGSLPMWVALRTTRWSMRRRLDSSERQLSDLRAMANRASDPAPSASPAPTTAATAPSASAGTAAPSPTPPPSPLDIP
ncbi:MAG: LapA family protein [Sphingopyxis sp.]|uniref:LapA family protein n=1 Tax=Sphingopyxis sp. TaxID=1908224 RepID=UPI002AB90742|nr:LapA family protein [Sphingopyxis sp.]MDZ3831384.1 LapA family protein [Sphingopyxis sp.]